MQARRVLIPHTGYEFGTPIEEKISGSSSTCTIIDNSSEFSCGVCYTENHNAVCILSFFPDIAAMLDAQNATTLLQALKSWVCGVAAVGARKLYATPRADNYWWHCYVSIGIAADLIEIEQAEEDDVEQILAIALNRDRDGVLFDVH